MCDTKEPKTELREMAILSGYDVEDNVVITEKLSVHDYYDGSHPMIDDEEYRKANSIKYIIGLIYDLDGRLDQKFKNQYDRNGELLSSEDVD